MEFFRKGVLSVAVATSVCWASLAHAVRIGEVELGSYIDEPLVARALIRDASDAELESLIVSLAPKEAFERAGIPRDALLADLDFEIRPPYLYLTSEKPVAEPFMLFMIRADWRGGSASRELALLLDPPGSNTAGNFSAPAPKVGSELVRAATLPPRIDTAEAQPTPSADTLEDVAQAVDELAEVVVQSGDSLSRIARRYFEPGLAPSLNDFTQALFELNPTAFIRGDINLIRAGATLQLPVSDTRVAQGNRPTQGTEVAVTDAAAALTLAADNQVDTVIDDTESQYLRQRIQELELELTRLQSENASRSAIGAVIAEETGTALAPLGVRTQLEQPETGEAEATAPAAQPPVAPIGVVSAAPTPVVVNPPAEPSVAEAPIKTQGLAERAVDTWASYSTLMVSGLAALLVFLAGFWVWRRKSAEVYEPQFMMADVTETEPSLGPDFDATPASAFKPMAFSDPNLAFEKARLLAAYGQLQASLELIDASLESGDDKDLRFLNLKADVLAKLDPGSSEALRSELAPKSTGAAMPAAANGDVDLEIDMDSAPMPGDNLSTIEFTLELDEKS